MNAPLLHARPDTTSSARLGGLCDSNSAYAGAERSRTGSFLPPQPIPDPKVQIDLREPEEIARAKAREDYDLWALLHECWAAVAADEATWEAERRADCIARGEPADAPRKVAVRNQHLVPDDDPYLAEERALRQAETGIVEDEDDGLDEHRALAIAHDDEPEEENLERDGEENLERDGEPAE